MERKAAISKLYAIVQFFGLPSWFVTVSPDDTNSRIVVTISDQCAWASQPVSSEPGQHKMRPPVEWTVCASYPKRARRIAENPVAAAKYFSALAESMMEHLCQLSCVHLTKKTQPHTARRTGVLGKTMAHFAALECQGRGSLHFHTVVWSKLSPELMQALASDEHDEIAEQTKTLNTSPTVCTTTNENSRSVRCLITQYTHYQQRRPELRNLSFCAFVSLFSSQPVKMPDQKKRRVI